MKLIHLLAGLAMLAPVSKAADEPDAFRGLPASTYHRIDPVLVDGGVPGRMSIPLAGESLEFGISAVRTHANGDRSYSGRPVAGKGSARITQGPAGVFGELRQDGRHWQVTTDRSGTWLVELPATGLSYNSCGTDHANLRPPASARAHGEQRPDRMSGTRSEDRTGTVIDLLVIYNRAFGDRYPGALLPTRVNHLVDIANQTMGNSGIDLGFRLVGLEFFDYRDDNANVDLLNDMASALGGRNPPGLEGLGAMRDELGADLVIMLRPHDIETRGNCGIAFYPFEDPRGGVNVVSDGMSSWSTCLDDVFTHEIGHNLGAAHQDGFGGGTFDSRGAAYVRPGQLNTIMASFGTGRPDRFRGLPVFSSPLFSCGGLPCGHGADTDNAAVVREVMPEVASYRPGRSAALLPEPRPRSDSDLDGDGVSDWLDHFPFDASEQDDADLDGAGDNSDAFPGDPSEWSDSDADGVGDNADDDDDGDGFVDADDAFPLDASEHEDPDRDGVGSNADAFPADPGEFRDFDGDGAGNNQDDDDDGDGFPELDPLAEDILVISAGNSRILRFDAATGAPRGIEVPPSDGLLTLQSDLAWRQTDHTLLYLGDSSIRRADLLNRRLLGTWVPPYNDDDPSAVQLQTGFPNSLEPLSGGSHVAVTSLNNASIAIFLGQQQARSDGVFNWAISEGEAPIELVGIEGEAIVLGQAFRSLYRIDSQGSFILGGPDLEWMTDPRRMLITGDGRLLITDRRRNAVLEVDPSTGEFLGKFANLAAIGYRGPTGLALTRAGELLVASGNRNAIVAFDAASGDFIGVRVETGSWGLRDPQAMIVVPALLDRRNDDPDRVLRPNPGLWYNPATDGRGFDIQVFGHRLTAIWYTFEQDGLPVWYFSSGVLDGFEYQGALLRFSLDNAGQAGFEEVGQLRLVFGSERAAQMSYSIGATAGAEPIQWLAFDHDPAPSDHTGLWGREDGPGWGISLATQGEKHVAIAFIYGADGQPRWVISDPVEGESPLAFTMSAVFSTTLCPACTGEPVTDFQPAGTMELSPGPGATWTSDIRLPMPAAGDWVLDAVPAIRFSDPAEAPR